MTHFLFILLCLIWLADMTVLIVLAPPVNHVLWFSVLYSLGHMLIVVLICKFPSGITGKKAYILIFVIGTTDRIVFLPYQAKNDVFRYIWEGYIQMVRYYGFYSNKSCGLRKKAGTDDAVPSLIESEVSSKRFRRNWARLIQIIYHVNPLVCTKCSGYI